MEDILRYEGVMGLTVAGGRDGDDNEVITGIEKNSGDW
jgi:hypothetical protein